MFVKNILQETWIIEALMPVDPQPQILHKERFKASTLPRSHLIEASV
jgi:hypothetical protein